MTEPNGEIKIDKNVPIPSSAKKGKEKYPFKLLEVGDSFVVNKPTAKISYFHGIAKYVGIKIAMRTVEGGTRVWRIK